MVVKENVSMLLNAYRDEIRSRSPKSYAVWQENRTAMPAGVGSLFRLADPFPMVVKRAQGARLWDADDNEYLDFMLGFGVMILGNGNVIMVFEHRPIPNRDPDEGTRRAESKLSFFGG